MQVGLRRAGFMRTMSWLARRSSAPASNSFTRSRDLAALVNGVAAQPVVGARCLGRSLVLWFMLRRRGVDADLVVGAEAPATGQLPAHAWVEVDGTPVNDAPDVRERFGSFGIPVPRLEPSE